MKINKLGAQLFWQWFSSHHKEFGENFDNEEMLAELNDRIVGLGDFAWEIGPGTKNNNQLVISPGGNLDLLPVSKQIISYATTIPGWIFCYAKPPREWNLLFNFRIEDDVIIEVNASKWKYVLLRYEDMGFEIIVQTRDLKNLCENDKLIAAEILLDGILGEEVRMIHITNIEIVEEVGFQYQNKVNDMIYLDKHFEKLV
jgi:hypothetical protein